MEDEFNLMRFLKAQESRYEQALIEIQQGKKSSHWMWYIFPQFRGLGFSQLSILYAIKSLPEAKAYLSHPILGPRLFEAVQAVLGIKGKSAFEIFGSPDDLKLKSCATLFESISPKDLAFLKLLEQFYDGSFDSKTLEVLKT